jgi:DNA invertase Pin-like site-specific DNA recombinase
MSRVIGYVRVSTDEQGRSGLGLAAQRRAILGRFPGAEIVEEVKSAGKLSNRPVLCGLLEELRRGDTLIVSRLDRLARSATDMLNTAQLARRRGWSLVLLDIGLDTGTVMGKAMLGMLAVFAELERDMICVRRRDAAVSRDPSLAERREQIRELAAAGLSQRAIQHELGLASKETVARVLREVAA